MRNSVCSVAWLLLISAHAFFQDEIERFPVGCIWLQGGWYRGRTRCAKNSTVRKATRELMAMRVKIRLVCRNVSCCSEGKTKPPSRRHTPCHPPPRLLLPTLAQQMKKPLCHQKCSNWFEHSRQMASNKGVAHLSKTKISYTSPTFEKWVVGKMWRNASAP